RRALRRPARASAPPPPATPAARARTRPRAHRTSAAGEPSPSAEPTGGQPADRRFEPTARRVRKARGKRPADRTGHAAAAATATRLLLLAPVGTVSPGRRLHRAGPATATQPRHVRARAGLGREAPGPRGEIPDRAGADDLRRGGPEALSPDRRATRVPRARAGARALAAVTSGRARG